MLGREHALSGAVAFAAAAPLLHPSALQFGTGLLAAAGAGVLCDIDHPDATISRTFGFLTETFAWLVNKLSGGHRHGTHSLVGIAAFTGIAYAAGAVQLHGPRWHMVPAVLILALLFSAALRALHIGGHHGDLIGTAAAVAACWTGADTATLPLGPAHVPLLALVVAMGCTAHLLTDMVTHGGCPLLWPVSLHDFHDSPIQITTGQFTETWVIRPALSAGLLWLLLRDAGAVAALHL